VPAFNIHALIRGASHRNLIDDHALILEVIG